MFAQPLVLAKSLEYSQTLLSFPFGSQSDRIQEPGESRTWLFYPRLSMIIAKAFQARISSLGENFRLLLTVLLKDKNSVP